MIQTLPNMRADSNVRPRVVVLMATYNGELYIGEQVESIFAQDGVDVCLFVHDDGSTDGTLNVLRNLQKDFGEQRIRIYPTDNMGYPASFWWLLDHVSDDYDWYAWADQDDVWLPDKLKAAVDKISPIATRPDRPMLYGSSSTIVDQDLHEIGVSRKGNVPVNLISFFMRARIAAHTLVFNAALVQELKRIAPKVPDYGHDHLSYIVCLAAGGAVVVDDESHVLHRRISSSLSSGGLGPLSRIRAEWRGIWGKTVDRPRLACVLLDEYGGNIKDDERGFLELVASERRSFVSRTKLMVYPHMDCGVPFAHAEVVLSLLLNRY